MFPGMGKQKQGLQKVLNLSHTLYLSGDFRMNTGIRTPTQTTNVAELRALVARMNQVVSVLQAENKALKNRAQAMPRSYSFIPPGGNRMIPAARRKTAYGAAFFGEKMERKMGFNH